CAQCTNVSLPVSATSTPYCFSISHPPPPEISTLSLHDALPIARVLFHGSVAGFGAGTGAAFSLLPAQNATGNWIKIVQRVPVRIALDAREVAAHPLQIGLSMKADVDVSGGTDGARLPQLA